MAGTTVADDGIVIAAFAGGDRALRAWPGRPRTTGR